MRDTELLESLLEVAHRAELEVRVVGARGAEAPPASGVCRVRDRIWVVLSPADPVDAQIDVMAAALRAHAREFLESSYLAPAVRSRIASSPAGIR